MYIKVTHSQSLNSHTHTITQDGKTNLDAFFARCMEFVERYISVHNTNKINKIGTALELGKALSYHGGINNSMV